VAQAAADALAAESDAATAAAEAEAAADAADAAEAAEEEALVALQLRELRLDEGGAGGGPEVLGRRCCYSHHIIAPGKRQAVMQWALQLGLAGLSKIGWPVT
jgi:hypothetical protein